jgi:phthiocerol/phenolphthiocerol synthesis type-I polyketide synthase E
VADALRPQAIAIIGMAARIPGARGLDAFWRNVREGVETLETFTDADLDAARVDPALRSRAGYVRRGSPLEEADHFDDGFFGFSPREAQIVDPQQRVFLECAWEALEHAGHAGAVAGQPVGVYAGSGTNSYLVSQLLANPPFLASAGGYQLMVGNEKDFLATRVSYKLDLRGPSMTVQTACSTSLVAVTLACRALQRGECDLALAGGVTILFPQRAGYLYEEGMILSPDGHCRPFDERARGTRGSSGAGVVVLKRLADALADRDTIHAVILGAAVNNDGAGKAGYTAPSIEGQAEAIATAQALSGIDPRTIGFLEAHGTGTPLGDPIEIAALTRVFRASTPDVGFCRLGSLKANVGHLDAAAGVAGLIKAVLVLKNRELPPLVNFQSVNPQLALDTSPFVASAAGGPWLPPDDGTPRRAAVSSFGIGGTNAHVVLEEAPPAPRIPQVRGAHLIVLSAKTPTALDSATAALAGRLRTSLDLSLADVAWTLQSGRQAFPHRRAVVARGAAHAWDLLGQPQRPPVLTALFPGGTPPVTFLFSGQGSQHVGMGAGLYRVEPVYRAAIDRCAAVLEPHLGLDLRALLFGSPDDPAIDETRITQPALFATEYALASLWQSWGIAPAAMLGHSIGEYVAAHLAGVLSLEDALGLVAARGRLMQAQPPGSMAAVPLAAPDLERFLREAPGVEIAAVNGPGLCTVSGPDEAIQALLRRLEATGIEARRLHTSHAFHSAMMEPALAPFLALLEKVPLSPPRIPYVSNLTGTWITATQASSPAYYAQHLRHAVQFEAGVQLLGADPGAILLEVGPGNALASLARVGLGKDGARRAIPSLPHPRERRADEEAMLEAAGRLWIAGVAVDWKGLHAGEEPHRVPLPTYAFERKRHFVEALPLSADSGAPRHVANVADWFYAPTWARDDSPVPEPRLAGTWLVLAQPGLLGEAVANRARRAGATLVLVEPGDHFERLGAARFRVRPGYQDDLAAAIRQAGMASPVAGALFVWSAGDDPGSAVELSFHSLVALAEAIAPAAPSAPVRIIAATFGAESVFDEPVRRFDGALARGPVLVLPAEVPGLRMRAVDLEPADDPGRIDDAARQLLEEASLVTWEPVVARRAGRRWVRRLERLRIPPAGPADLPVQQGGVYLITGGLGGIGLTLARWLAARASARLLLTGRTPLPPRDRWDAWLAEHGTGRDRASEAIRGVRAIEEVGGEVLIETADATDEAAMRRAVNAARDRWSRIDGVIHAAGISGNARVAFLKGRGDVQAVLAPRVDGLAVLLRLLGDVPLDFAVLVGCLNSSIGGPGVCDLASASAFLDAFVDSIDRPAAWRRVMTLDYSAWRDVGMSARLVTPGARREAWEEHVRTGIPPESGADAFARALASGRRRLIIAPFDLVRASESIREQAGEGADPGLAESSVEPTAPSRDSKERPAVSAPFEAPTTETQRRLTAIWTELLGIERIGLHDDFFELGGHSLLATRVIARIDQVLGARLSLRDVFEAATIHRLAEKVDAARREAGKVMDVVGGDREELEF